VKFRGEKRRKKGGAKGKKLTEIRLPQGNLVVFANKNFNLYF